MHPSWKQSEDTLRNLSAGRLGYHVREVAQTRAELPALALAVVLLHIVIDFQMAGSPIAKNSIWAQTEALGLILTD